MYEKFAELLVKNNKTAYAVSKETGISQSVLSDWKRGRSNPKVDKLQKLADYFGVSIEYFLEGQAESFGNQRKCRGAESKRSDG